MEGRIVKAYGGYYYVHQNNEIVRCYARGRLRQEVERLLVGDMVRFSLEDGEHEGVVEDVLPRKSQLLRPPVANVEQVLLVFACKEPDPQPLLIDRMLVLIGAAGLDVGICFNKVDLAEEVVKDMISTYKKAGYVTMLTSAKTGVGCEDVKRFLKGKVSVFAGPSGVGKSALLNSLDPDFNLKTGEVSKKLGRGRHTTRNVEFLPICGGGLVADSPGFTSIDLRDLSTVQLPHLFPDIGRFIGECRFSDCSHRNEPGCFIQEAVRDGHIGEKRYESYLKFYEEISEFERSSKQWNREEGR
jgi:ribosome biogenesis GTPase